MKVGKHNILLIAALLVGVLMIITIAPLNNKAIADHPIPVEHAHVIMDYGVEVHCAAIYSPNRSLAALSCNWERFNKDVKRAK